MTEVRAFTWSDAPLLRRLSPMGVSLDTVTGLTRGLNPLNDAFLASLPLGDRGMPTYVLRDDKGHEAIGQLRHREGTARAYIAHIAPNLPDSFERNGNAECVGWLHLIDGLVAAAGARGAASVNAEVDPNSPAFAVLRQAGFAVFARQDIWRRPPAAVGPSPGRRLQPATALRQVEVTTLYANTVPRLVQQAVPPPEADDVGLVCVGEGGHVAGHIAIYEGRRGVLLRALLHPEVEQVGELFADALTYLSHPERVPVYCTVQRHQDWLREPLAEIGFAPWARQAVMVKYTVHRVQYPSFQPLPALEQAPPVAEMQVAGEPFDVGAV